MIKTIPKKKKCKKTKWLSEEVLQKGERRREAKSKGEKEKYTYLNAEFQRIARRGKKAFLSDQCKEIEAWAQYEAIAMKQWRPVPANHSMCLSHIVPQAFSWQILKSLCLVSAGSCGRFANEHLWFLTSLMYKNNKDYYHSNGSNYYRVVDRPQAPCHYYSIHIWILGGNHIQLSFKDGQVVAHWVSVTCSWSPLVTLGAQVKIKALQLVNFPNHMLLSHCSGVSRAVFCDMLIHMFLKERTVNSIVK